MTLREASHKAVKLALKDYIDTLEADGHLMPSTMTDTDYEFWATSILQAIAQVEVDFETAEPVKKYD